MIKQIATLLIQVKTHTPGIVMTSQYDYFVNKRNKVRLFLFDKPAPHDASLSAI